MVCTNQCPPIQLYKHHVQFQYNKGKPGLDKSTEAGLRVTHVTPLSFETKYVFTMIDRVLVNCWRAENAITVIEPWIRSLKNGNKPTPTLQQIRRKFHNTATIDDYIQCFSEGYLTELHERDDSLPANYLNCAGYTSKQRLTSTDKATLSIINVYQGKMRWPIQRFRYQTFHEDKGLNHLRMYKSNSVKHVPEIINDGTKEGRQKCALCSRDTV